MRGSIKRRYKGSWSLILDAGVVTDPATGLSKRKQRWITFRGTKKQAEDKLAELVRSANRGELPEPTKATFGEWLDEWLDKSVKPRKAAGTYTIYSRIVALHVKPSLGGLRLQALGPLDIERYYAGLGLAPATAQLHHAVIHNALAAALRANLVSRNVANLVSGKPRARESHQDVLDHCWRAEEARRFLQAASEAGPQWAAFFALALDSGMRKGELCGLQWGDVDIERRQITIQRQLLKPGNPPTFGPMKNKAPRVIEVSGETADLLRRHKARQAEIKLANRKTYHDNALVFAKDWDDCTKQHDVLGDALQANNLGQRIYQKIIKAAGVRAIKLHGLRHTSATLLLQAGVPAHVVQRRLGHKRIEMTLGIYGHVLPAMQQDAAAKLAALLHG